MPSSVSAIDGLTERQRLAAHLLAQGKTIREVARNLSVSEKTVYLYRQRPAVQQAIFRMQTEMMEQTGGRTLSQIPAAMDCLNSIINDPEARDADKIAAARALINSANSFSERRILERQIEDLEKALRSVLAPDASVTPEDDQPLDPLLPSADPEDYD